MTTTHSWRHGWIPLTMSAALAKAHGNHAQAAKLLGAAREHRAAKRDAAARTFVTPHPAHQAAHAAAVAQHARGDITDNAPAMNHQLRSLETAVGQAQAEKSGHALGYTRQGDGSWAKTHAASTRLVVPDTAAREARTKAARDASAERSAAERAAGTRHDNAPGPLHGVQSVRAPRARSAAKAPAAKADPKTEAREAQLARVDALLTPAARKRVQAADRAADRAAAKAPAAPRYTVTQTQTPRGRRYKVAGPGQPAELFTTKKAADAWVAAEKARAKTRHAEESAVAGKRAATEAKAKTGATRMDRDLARIQLQREDAEEAQRQAAARRDHARRNPRPFR